MSESTRSGFTVTLGRGGRVVKKAGGLPEEGFHNDRVMTRSKRSIRDRLGGNSDDRHHPYSKRQRGEGFGTSSVNDMHLRKDDLRFKLMQKNTSRQSQNSDSHGNIDLRDKLSSRTSRQSVDNKAIRPPESAVTTRHPLVEPRNTGLPRYPILEPRDASILGRYPSSRNPSELSVVNPGRAYSSWTLDNLRRRSPEKLYHSSACRVLSPERSREDLQRRPIRGPYDDGRSSCMRVSPPRPVTSSSFVIKSSLSAAPVKSSVPLPPHYAQASGIIHKIPSTIDKNALKQLGDTDLKELGIPMGPRKKILQSLAPRSRRLP
ncbi:uncharacterized protein [Spinacia oleracea]|uniref:Uncharacterized protein isoform X2 n=1 Tax=Spinacia oleracea TaxID=3562 RepID=A0ABM3QH06_SPIOL|nr:uncharacterized protein LOC110782879 isoform X2 [Spinacia oleracea]